MIIERKVYPLDIHKGYLSTGDNFGPKISAKPGKTQTQQAVGGDLPSASLLLKKATTASNRSYNILLKCFAFT